MRLFLIALTVGGIVVAFLTHSPGVLGLSLLVAFIGAVGTVFSIAAERIADRARPDAALLEPDVIAAIRDRAQRQTHGTPPQGRPAAPAAQRPVPPVRPPQG
ncbi:hypothetical protein ACQQ2N_06745 [Dokdonella sp. MW10]|uniref:hypothetical protein n=1 Tax=Dokdonella sp. MW10 TaxID=2992926 RepID=UPI003F80A1B4